MFNRLKNHVQNRNRGAEPGNATPRQANREPRPSAGQTPAQAPAHTAADHDTFRSVPSGERRSGRPVPIYYRPGVATSASRRDPRNADYDALALIPDPPIHHPVPASPRSLSPERADAHQSPWSDWDSEMSRHSPMSSLHLEHSLDPTSVQAPATPVAVGVAAVQQGPATRVMIGGFNFVENTELPPLSAYANAPQAPRLPSVEVFAPQLPLPDFAASHGRRTPVLPPRSRSASAPSAPLLPSIAVFAQQLLTPVQAPSHGSESVARSGTMGPSHGGLARLSNDASDSSESDDSGHIFMARRVRAQRPRLMLLNPTCPSEPQR